MLIQFDTQDNLSQTWRFDARGTISVRTLDIAKEDKTIYGLVIVANGQQFAADYDDKALRDSKAKEYMEQHLDIKEQLLGGPSVSL